MSLCRYTQAYLKIGKVCCPGTPENILLRNVEDNQEKTDLKIFDYMLNSDASSYIACPKLQVPFFRRVLAKIHILVKEVKLRST